MNHQWPMVSLRDVLVPVSRPERVDPEKLYRLLGAHWYAEGLYTKDTAGGSQIRADQVFRVERGDFVYNRLFAWKGSFAVATHDNDGCYVSNEFPCFNVRPDRADGKFLWMYFSLPEVWDEILSLSAGGTPTSRNRLKETQLLAMQIPLPPISEQRRVVARTEELFAKIDEAQSLREQVKMECENLCRSIVLSGVAKPTLMRELVKLRECDVAVKRDETYEFAGVYCFGRGVFKSLRKSGSEFAYSRLTRLKAGNFIYPKLMAWEGALGIVPQDCDGRVVSPEFPVFEVDETRVLPETLDVYFRMPSVWPELAAISTGTNVRRRRLHPTAFLEFMMPLPDMTVQARLRATKKLLDALQPVQDQTYVELDALRSSLLSRAFSRNTDRSF